MNQMKLTPDLIQQLEAINLDRAAADRTFDLALNFHRSCTNQIETQTKQFWEMLGEKYNIDVSQPWSIAKEDGEYVIKPADIQIQEAQPAIEGN